jgi:hypothetical protein
MLLLHESHRLAQQLQDLEPLRWSNVIAVQLLELPEKPVVGGPDVDEG